MNVYTYICFLAAIAILLEFVNSKINDKIQSTIAITAFAMIGSILLLLLGKLGWFNLDQIATQVMEKIDFKSFLLNGILGFLLFAGALSIKLPVMKDQKWEITIFSLFSTLASAFIVGILIYFISNSLGLGIDFIYCLLFGALISPTDPIAVLAIIKSLRAPKRLSMQVEGESLFNDGVGLVIFITVFTVAFSGKEPTLAGILQLFLHEAVGGILFGLALGFVVHVLISNTDDGSLEILLSLIVPTAGFMLANMLEVSGALAMVVSGIMVGNWTRQKGFSEQSQRYMDHFWEMIDHFLNSLLFFLIGFALLLVDFTFKGFLLMLFAIPVCLAARYISLWLPFKVMQCFRTYNPYTLKILTWGGLRGGLSMAMALSIPAGIAFTADHTDIRDLLLVTTYAVVMFSILVQGVTIESMVQRSKMVDPNSDEYLHPTSATQKSDH